MRSTAHQKESASVGQATISLEEHAGSAQLEQLMTHLLASVERSVKLMRSTVHQKESASAGQATISLEELADNAQLIHNMIHNSVSADLLVE
jgi:hypothetical protein